MDAVNYALSKRMSWNDLKDKPFYDRETTTISQSIWSGGYHPIQSDWTEIFDLEY